jgi:hypothetical protein
LNAFYNEKELEKVIKRAQDIPLSTVKLVSKLVNYDELALFDVCVLVDDSGAMQFVNNGESIDDLKFVLSTIAPLISLFDHDGISVRFLNSSKEFDNLCSSNDIIKSIDKIELNGSTLFVLL